MRRTLAVLDASPLIIYHQIGHLELVRRLFDNLVAPPVVAREIVPSLGALPPWVTERHPASIPDLLQDLDPGEREAIALATQLGSDAIVLDDLAARRAARQLGLNVTGSAGLLVQARRRGLIEAARPLLDAMVAHGLWVSERLYRDTLISTGEAES